MWYKVEELRVSSTWLTLVVAGRTMAYHVMGMLLLMSHGIQKWSSIHKQHHGAGCNSFSLLISNYLSISLRHTSYDFSQMVMVSRVAIQFSRSLEAWSLYVTQFLYIVFAVLLAALTASVCVHLTMSQLLMEQGSIVRIQAISHTLHTISIAPHQMQRMQRPLTWCVILIAIPKHKRLFNYFPTLNGLFTVTLPTKEMAGLVTLAHGHLMWVHSRIASTFIRFLLLLSWSLHNCKWQPEPWSSFFSIVIIYLIFSLILISSSSHSWLIELIWFALWFKSSLVISPAKFCTVNRILGQNLHYDCGHQSMLGLRFSMMQISRRLSGPWVILIFSFHIEFQSPNGVNGLWFCLWRWAGINLPAPLRGIQHPIILFLDCCNILAKQRRVPATKET